MLGADEGRHVAARRGLGGERVHHLGARDARKEVEREARDLAVPHGKDRRLVAARDEADHDGPGGVLRGLFGGRWGHLQDDLRPVEEGGSVGNHLGATWVKVLPGSRPRPRSGLDPELGAGLDQLLHDLRDERDAGLSR